jgi:hypothetical protein
VELQGRGHPTVATLFRRLSRVITEPSGFSASLGRGPIDDLVIGVTIPSGSSLYNERRRSSTP